MKDDMPRRMCGRSIVRDGSMTAMALKQRKYDGIWGDDLSTMLHAKVRRMHAWDVVVAQSRDGQ